ncbi:MAG: cadmium-translocating P-type ATPase [Lachnospiraceae bacterium]|nr:cadmium-translocating P-type ATPase [Ruminococcus sp.]MCM1277162.1 cadmium-translocating P-type ATPase [Lachnospiraceae bacterium]
MSRKQKRMLVRIIIAAVVFAAGLFVPETEETFSALWFVRLGVFLCAYFTAGWDILWKAIRNIAHGQVFDENFLMAIASVGAMVIGEYSEGVAVMIFYQVGELFQSVAVGKSRKNISDMMDINPEYANVERDGEVSEVEPDEVEVGETVVIKPGERVPLDGEIIFGSSGLNTAALTGESALREVTVGDEVISGSVNTNGLLKIRVTKPYSDSTVAKILELVENSSDNKAKTENFITRFARVYTPVVVIAALLVAVVPPLIIGLSSGMSGELWSGWIYKALTFLVVSCPCALVISVPLSYFGGIGGASRHGIMIKGANYLEALAKARTFVFDKTGTLTKGSFAVSEKHAEGISESGLLAYCAAAEQISNHPIAVSIVNAARALGDIPKADDAEELAGFGVRAVVDGREIAVGNARLMEKIGAAAAERKSAGTIVHCAVDGKYCGYIIVSDEIKENSAGALAELKRLGAERTVMLTGDRELTANAVAKAVGVDEVRSQLLPDGKVKAVEELCKLPNSALAYVGDGMNDAPSLARADVGIAMGALGSDAAIEAADIVLMNDNILNLPLAVRIARKTRRIVTENIVFALGVKLAVLVLTLFNIGNMWAAVFADVGVSVIAIINAMRCMRIK